MKFRDKRTDDVNLDLTPFIDVVFMLLLFFVVSTTLFKGANQLGVQLPKANAQPLSKNKNAIEIGIDATGHYFLNGQALGTAESEPLKIALAKELQARQSPVLLLMGDKAAPHQQVVSALAIASELGVTQMQIVAQAQQTKK